MDMQLIYISRVYPVMVFNSSTPVAAFPVGQPLWI